VEPFDSEHVERRALRAHHVAHGDGRETLAVGLAIRCDRGRSGRAVTTSECVDADDRERIRIEELTRPDEPAPPVEDA
jgi:hypothetical protein